MKIPIHRETFRIVLCLLLGVVTTVAVAWGLAYWPPPMQDIESPFHEMESFHLDIIPLGGEARFVGFFARDSWSVSAIDVWGFPQEYGLHMVYGRTDIEPSLDASDQLVKLGYTRLPQWSAARRSFGVDYPFQGFGAGFICDRAFGWPTRGMSYSTVITPLHFPTTLAESAGLLQISGRHLSSDSWVMSTTDSLCAQSSPASSSTHSSTQSSGLVCSSASVGRGACYAADFSGGGVVA